MKRACLSLIAALMFAGCSSMVGAPPNNQLANQLFFIAGCSSYTPTSVPLNGAICEDTGNGGLYTWQSTAFVVTNTGLTAPGAIGGTTPAAGSFTAVNATATGKTAFVTTNGGHITALLGTGSLPTVGTGTVTAGGTDTAMEVTGGTSPVTVTFTTAFAAQPICVCGDETAATGVCKVVPNANGATAVVTTASTDSFNLVCIGK